VPAAHLARRLLVPAETDGVTSVFLVDPVADGVTLDLDEATNRQMHGEVTLDGAGGDRLGADGAEVVRWTVERATLGLCALQVGVCESALHATAEYTSQRHQFGRPLSTNQGVALRAADAYIDIEAMRATLWAAAWRITEGLPAAAEVAAAKWWASEGGHRVVHSTQHLHGGMGADIDYPVHRTFLWAKQIAHTLGGPSQQLVRLGSILKEEVA
jgi:alkylation response protein AidB-like acyl-CoA dehydrogenase